MVLAAAALPSDAHAHCAHTPPTVKTLLLTVFQSITEVFLLCIAGYVLASTGVTDKATQRKLNVINVSLFTPALLFSKVAFSLTPSKLKEMWIIPLGFVLITGASAGVAWFLSKLFKLKRSQTAFAMCAAMFQNSNSLPIALVQSLVVEVPGLKWGPDDNKDMMLGRALTYMVLYSTLGMMLRWSWGVRLLSSADEEEEVNKPLAVVDLTQAAPIVPSAPAAPADNAYASVFSRITTEGNGYSAVSQVTDEPEVLSPEPIQRTDPFVPGSPARPASVASVPALTHRPRALSPSGVGIRSPSPSLPLTGSVASQISMHDPSGVPGGLRGRAGSNQRRSSNNSTRRARSRTDSGREFWGLPEQPRSRHPLQEVVEDSSASEAEAESEDEWGGGELPSLRRRRSPTTIRTPLQVFRDRVRISIISSWATFNSFMTVPMWSALISIGIALIPPFQAWLSGIKPFVQAVKSAGQCSIPVTLVVLGAFFYTPPQPIALETTEERPKSIRGYIESKIHSLAGGSEVSGSAAYPGENKTVFVACVSRMIVVPLIFLPFIALLARYDLFEAAEDPVFILCAVLLVSSPPALTLAQITQAASGDAFERLISKTISWSYAVLTPPLTLIYVVIGLVFSKM
ncbi:hypothetical protein VHUM_00845 [Vanrija humicola]|uniref:Transporter n=1 Tax=Vanrija humicola TaxID=5417 RepID=A0A7D8V4L4_VANHU|nr:hypothetical protein VHUM_00845 [Vanrija humicola]